MIRDCIEPRAERELDLALWAGGDLAPEASAPIEAHLAACPGCRSFLRELRESQGALASLADEPVDPEALARVRRAVHRRIEEEAGREERKPAWALALAAGLLLALVAAAVWLRGGDPGRPAPSPAASDQMAEAPRVAPPTAPAGSAPPAPDRRPAAEREVAPPPAPRAAAPESSTEPFPPNRVAAAGPSGPAAPPTATESMVIQVVSNDPDIVFYWLVEPEETADETLSTS